MPKFYYKPVVSLINEVYKENAGEEFKPLINIEENVRVVVEADSREVADKSRIGYLDVRMWEFDKVED
ncbi:MAG: hypothetical protein ACK5P0_00360 [bacterium]